MNDPENKTTTAPASDQARRFLFELADIRGESVQLDTAFSEILAIHQYAPGVSRLLGELMAATLQSQELLELGTEQLLYQLYHEESLRLFTPTAVAFHCSCSRERTLRALSAIEPAELENILEEQGAITMDCEFCNQQYRHQREDLQDLLGPVGSPPILH